MTTQTRVAVSGLKARRAFGARTGQWNGERGVQGRTAGGPSSGGDDFSGDLAMCTCGRVCQAEEQQM